MTAKRTKAIIAVFGSDDADAVTLAKDIGRSIAAEEQIVLTGGTRAGSRRVKESAIAGAGSSPWIGVARGKAVDASETGSGFVILTDLDHKRNYLEACLCDAAIGLAGGPGTLSEVTFSLSLQRPVALVGHGWTPKWSLGGSNHAQVLSAMVGSAFDHVGSQPSGRRSLDALLNARVIRAALDHLPSYSYFPLGSTAEAIVDWILRALSQMDGMKLRGALPFIEGYERVAAEYEKWLTRHAV